MREINIRPENVIFIWTTWATNNERRKPRGVYIIVEMEAKMCATQCMYGVVDTRCMILWKAYSSAHAGNIDYVDVW